MNRRNFMCWLGLSPLVSLFKRPSARPKHKVWEPHYYNPKTQILDLHLNETVYIVSTDWSKAHALAKRLNNALPLIHPHYARRLFKSRPLTRVENFQGCHWVPDIWILSGPTPTARQQEVLDFILEHGCGATGSRVRFLEVA